MFLVKNTGYLPLHKDHDHVINLVDGKQLFYGPIYSLTENKISIFWAYINKNLANRFIWPSKSLAGAPIFFVPKLNEGLWLCINYWGLNNLTIKNWYPFYLVGKFLDRLGQTKQFTKLDYTNAYYRICNKKGDK